ncbi:MAG TPA: 30S ribosome-binding factor RbfA, partial [Polyangiaceae bacterium]|nr:30S ribosome-binding factor RbfA [Polyangiaceae bacterium]
RTLRVAGLVQTHLTTALARELGDPELSTLVVTHVDVSKDLSIATARVRRLSIEDGPEARKAVIARLKRAVPRLRRALGPALKLRRVPDLRFIYDTGQDAHDRVDALLAEIERERDSGKS